MDPVMAVDPAMATASSLILPGPRGYVGRNDGWNNKERRREMRKRHIMFGDRQAFRITFAAEGLLSGLSGWPGRSMNILFEYFTEA
jgi:hypothetical protein